MELVFRAKSQGFHFVFLSVTGYCYTTYIQYSVTLYGMKRIQVHTVTMPILVSAESAKEADGRAPMLLGDSGLIRVVSDADALRWQKKELPSSRDHALFVGINKLFWAWNEKDEFTAAAAFEILAPFVQSNIPREAKTISVGKGVSLKWGGWNLSDIPSAYTSLVTEKFEQCRFVVWYAETPELEGRILPGLYCPNKKTAVFAMGVMKRLVVCPKCDIAFVPGAGNVDYCSIKHRESYRVSRYRGRQIEKERSGGASARARTKDTTL